MGSFSMNSQLIEDTDEECCDDPIKLFESDENAIYFGSKTTGRSRKDKDYQCPLKRTGNYVFFQPSEDSTFRKPSEQTSLNGSISECDFSQVCVKLVDCGKYPWYFRKYTEQILCKINFDLESDSEGEIIDVEGIENCSLDDCFIVEDLQTFSNEKDKCELKKNEVNALQTKLAISDRILLTKLEKMKRTRDDIEIKKALNQKNKTKIDLKRNQGLIGMKIKQKIEKNVALDVKTDTANEVKIAKRKEILADEMYISAADKTLGHIGTRLIPISNEEQSNVDKNIVSDKQKNIESISSTNLPVAKISEKPINYKKVKKKVSDKKYLNYLENKLNITNEVEVSSKMNMTVKPTNYSNKSSSHVKDVKKTNKYKNDQSKIKNKVGHHNSLVGVLISKTKDFKYIKPIKHEVKDVKQSKDAMKPQKKVEKQKRESHSPIPSSSIIPKKPKIDHDMLPKCNKSDENINISKEADNLNEIANKIIQSCCPSKNIITKSFIREKSEVSQTKPVFQKQACILQDKIVNQVNDTRAQTVKLPDKHVQNCTDINNSNFETKKSHSIQLIPSSHNNKTPGEKHLIPATCQDNVNNKLSQNIATVNSHSPSGSTKNAKPPISNKEVPMKTVITSISEQKNATISNQYVNSTNSNITPLGEPKNATISKQNANSTGSNITPLGEPKNATISNQYANSTDRNIKPLGEPKNATISKQNANSTGSNITPLGEPKNATISNQYANSTDRNIKPMPEPRNATISNQHGNSTNKNITPISEPKNAIISNQCANSTDSNITPMSEPKNAIISNQCANSTDSNITPMSEPRIATISNTNGKSTNSNITPMNEPKNATISKLCANYTDNNITSMSEPSIATISNQHVNSNNSNITPMSELRSANISNQSVNSSNNNITLMSEPRNATISNQYANSTNSNITPISESSNAPISYQHANSTNSNSFSHQFPIQNMVAGKIKNLYRNSFPSNNINIPVHNRYASAIILKANHFQVGDNQHQYPAQTGGPQRNTEMHIPSILSIHKKQPRFQNQQNLHSEYYQPAPSSIFQKIFPHSVTSAVPNQFHPLQDNIGQQFDNPTPRPYRGWLPRNLAYLPQPSPVQDNIGQQLNNPTPSHYRGWLTRNAAHPPQPPLLPTPRNNPQTSLYEQNQTTCYSYSNPPFYPLAPVSQKPQNTFSQNLENAPDFENSSIIGRNNGGLVKKINIGAVPVAKNVDMKEDILSEEVKDPEILTYVKPEVFSSKTQMLEELEKSSFADENVNDLNILHDERKLYNTKKVSTFQVKILSEKPKKIESLTLTVNQKNYVTQTEQPRGCSSPDFPKPNQNIVDHVVTESQKQIDKPKNIICTEEPNLPKSSFKNGIKPVTKRDISKCSKRNLTVNQKNYVTQIEQPRGCSSPVLLKPTYEKTLDRVVTLSQTQVDKPKNIICTKEPKSNFENKIKPVTNRDFGKFCKSKLTVNQKNHVSPKVQPKGYSPPILPIPTYEKILDQVVTDTQTQNDKSKKTVRTDVPKSNLKNKTKNKLTKRDCGEFRKKIKNLFYEPDCSERKDEAKKISIDEYKKRFQYDGKNERSNKKMCKEKCNSDGKRPNIDYKYRENVDYSMEIDLGYDSDSTVVL